MNENVISIKKSIDTVYHLQSVTQMLLLRGDKGREAAEDSPGPERVRDSPSSLKGTRLDCLLLAVVRETSLESSIVDPTGLPFLSSALRFRFGERLFRSARSDLVASSVYLSFTCK